MTPRSEIGLLRSVESGEAPPAHPDVAGAEVAARSLLAALDADLEHESLRDTPRRMAAALAELLTCATAASPPA